METTSFDEKKYFLIIVHDYTRAVWVEPLTCKSEVVSKVRKYSNQFKTGYNVKICNIMADNRTGFVNNEMN